jgi:pyruvate/2-oxoglutarate dehydrogenase complex dihydrolipoamide dehydrogenase (E3) component
LANAGTLPSKTQRAPALAISGLRTRNLCGVDLLLLRGATVADFMFHEQRVAANERKRIERNLTGYGVVRYCGTASFVDPHITASCPKGPGEAMDITVQGAEHENRSDGPGEFLLRGE